MDFFSSSFAIIPACLSPSRELLYSLSMLRALDMTAALDEGFCDMRHEAAIVEMLSSELSMDFSIPLELLRM